MKAYSLTWLGIPKYRDTALQSRTLEAYMGATGGKELSITL